jgi:nitric oxide reductase subunit B
MQAMVWRMVFGLMTAAGGGLLFWDLLEIGKGEKRAAAVITAEQALAE